MDVWRAMIRAQGGDPDAPLPIAPEAEAVRSEVDGVVTAVDAYGVGVAAWRLGAGRARKEDPVSAGAGVLLHKKPGDPVRAGEVLFELRTEESARIPAALADIRAGVVVAAAATGAPADRTLIIDRIG
jgi:thymidine phosphorylase